MKRVVSAKRRRAALAALALMMLTSWLGLVPGGGGFGTDVALGDEMNFPQPEFTSEYDFPLTTVPEPTSATREWIDVGVLFLALSLASWLAVKKRSRRGLFWLSFAHLRGVSFSF